MYVSVTWNLSTETTPLVCRPTPFFWPCPQELHGPTPQPLCPQTPAPCSTGAPGVPVRARVHTQSCAGSSVHLLGRPPRGESPRKGSRKGQQDWNLSPAG